MIKEFIKKVSEGKNLSVEESRNLILAIMSGHVPEPQIAAVLVALKTKGETVDEITGSAIAMREKSLAIDVAIKVDIEDGMAQECVLDTCGTGGSVVKTFNISTCVAFVVAGCGVKVAKHGNRSGTTLCGSADVMEALGINIEISPENSEEAIKKIGIGFLYAPIYHLAMRHVANVRKEIGIRTIFNILGPLTNPANATAQVLGVYDAKLTEVMAQVLKNLGSRHAFVVNGEDGLDEVSISARTKVTELKDGKVNTYYVEPADFGIKKAGLDEVRGADAKGNAEIVNSVLRGKTGPARDIVLINAAVALIAAGRTTDLKRGVEIAAGSIDSKKALLKLIELKDFSNRFRK